MIPEKIGTDNQCEFSKWLYGASLVSIDKNEPHYENVRKLHAEFHQIAGNVAQLAVEGKKDEARKLIGANSRFACLSDDLTKAMVA